MKFSEFCRATGFDPQELTDHQLDSLHDLHAVFGEKEPEPQEQAERENLPLSEVTAGYHDRLNGYIDANFPYLPRR